MSVLIEFGRTTALLGDRFRDSSAHLPQDVRDAWWERTDYGWTCSACPNCAGVNYRTPADANRGANAHAAEHPGSVVQEASR